MKKTTLAIIILTTMFVLTALAASCQHLSSAKCEDYIDYTKLTSNQQEECYYDTSIQDYNCKTLTTLNCFYYRGDEFIHQTPFDERVYEITKYDSSVITVSGIKYTTFYLTLKRRGSYDYSVVINHRKNTMTCYGIDKISKQSMVITYSLINNQ